MPRHRRRPARAERGSLPQSHFVGDAAASQKVSFSIGGDTTTMHKSPTNGPFNSSQLFLRGLKIANNIPGRGLSKEKSLRLLDSEIAANLQLLFRLNGLGDGFGADGIGGARDELDQPMADWIVFDAPEQRVADFQIVRQIGRASCRERVEVAAGREF